MLVVINIAVVSRDAVRSHDWQEKSDVTPRCDTLTQIYSEVFHRCINMFHRVHFVQCFRQTMATHIFVSLLQYSQVEMDMTEFFFI